MDITEQLNHHKIKNILDKCDFYGFYRSMLCWYYRPARPTVLGTLALGILVALGDLNAAPSTSQAVLNLGDERELFVDHYLIDALKDAHLQLHEPQDQGNVFRFDQPWEGQFCGYCTVIHEGTNYQLYYRGKPAAKPDGISEVTCLAASTDGINWSRPDLELVEWNGNRSNNIILAVNGLSHNFSPLLDANPAAPPDQRYKAISGTSETGIFAFVSPDGRHWKKLSEEPILTIKAIKYSYAFDSQNVAFWSAKEQTYLMYFRVYKDKMRRIARAQSQDFVHWTNVTLMDYRDAHGDPAKVEHLYINQTQPYARAPQIYISTAARFMLGREVISAEEAKAINVNPSYFKDTSDAIFMSSRGSNIYDRTFMTGYIWPGIGPQNWVSRTTYPALNVVQTSPSEMSIYANQNYAQPTAHLRRYSQRLDGFASVRAPYEGGEMLTKPFTFTGKHLLINFATSAAGDIRVELQDATGNALPGFTLKDSAETIGNEIERRLHWHDGDDLSQFAGQPVRLRFVMHDADLYALHFTAN
jgi:hypothetical protein